MNRKFVITAGPTREYLDPVRFLSNPSTGKMGFAIARAAAANGFEVTLVAGPVSLKTPKGVKRVDVVSARDMLAAVEAEIAGAGDVTVIGVAAVADWRPEECAERKLKKNEMSGILKLVRNPDILKTLNENRKAGLKLVGFAAETDDLEREAVRKCREKGLEFIVANDVTMAGCGFGTDTNRATVFRSNGSVERLPMMSKIALARRIIRMCNDVN